jgi:uncharacterized membrane protein YqaE (UPF0057 family)
MLYLLAILIPPLAVFLVGRPVQGFLNILLCCFFMIPGIIHAIFVVHEKKADKRMERQVKMMNQTK